LLLKEQFFKTLILNLCPILIFPFFPSFPPTILYLGDKIYRILGNDKHQTLADLYGNMLRSINTPRGNSSKIHYPLGIGRQKK